MRAKSIKNKAKINREWTIPELLAKINKMKKKLKLRNQKIRQLEKLLKENKISLPEYKE